MAAQMFRGVVLVHLERQVMEESLAVFLRIVDFPADE
jgi:hypothetical protein